MVTCLGLPVTVITSDTTPDSLLLDCAKHAIKYGLHNLVPEDDIFFEVNGKPLIRLEWVGRIYNGKIGWIKLNFAIIYALYIIYWYNYSAYFYIKFNKRRWARSVRLCKNWKVCIRYDASLKTHHHFWNARTCTWIRKK